MPAIRKGGPADLEAIASIQAACPEAADWPVQDYLEQTFRVAELDGAAAGFLVARSLIPEEHEILNLAVRREFRRRGVARRLLKEFLENIRGAVYLEVRASNQAALNLYKSMGFQEVGSRKRYYASPPEDGIVLKFHSC